MSFLFVDQLIIHLGKVVQSSHRTTKSLIVTNIYMYTQRDWQLVLKTTTHRYI